MDFFKLNDNLRTWLPRAAVWRAAYERGGSLNLAAAISAEAARLVTLELSSRIHGSQRADFLDKSYAEVIKNARNFCEIACALGGVMLKPYLDGDRIITAFIPADAFEVTRFCGDGKICGVKFFQTIKEDNIIFTKCEEHEWDGDSYLITNRAYKSRGGKEKQISLQEVEQWADIEPSVRLEGVKTPLFSYFKMPFIDQSDITSALGAPIFARAGRLMDDAQKQYERILWEFESGERALYVDETAVRRNFRGESALPQKRLYRLLNTGNDELFMDWSPEIRDEQLINGFERILQRIEFNCGLAYGTLSDPQTVEKTAEELRASKQRSYATITEIQTALREALCDWAKAADTLCGLYALAPEGEYSIDFSFDDSIIADRKTEFEERLQLFKEGIITAEEMRSWYMGENTERMAKV